RAGPEHNSEEALETTGSRLIRRDPVNLRPAVSRTAPRGVSVTDIPVLATVDQASSPVSPPAYVEDRFPGDAASEQGIGGLHRLVPRPAPADLRVQFADRQQCDEVSEVATERRGHVEVLDPPPRRSRARQ